MKRKDTAVEADRRSFLKLAGLGVVAAPAALVAGEKAEAAAPTSKTAAGYRETEHVKRVYETSSF
jgi:hypothetical protein